MQLRRKVSEWGREDSLESSARSGSWWEISVTPDVDVMARTLIPPPEAC